MKRIGVFQNRPGIGDMCIFLPLIQSISRYYSQPITLFTKSRSKSKELLKYDINIGEIIYTDKNSELSNLYYLFNYIKKLKLEKVFIFSYGFRYPMIFKLANVKEVFYYGLFKRNRPIFEEGKNLLDRVFGKGVLELNCKLFLKNKIEQKNNSCVIGIGGSGPTKKWSIKNYAELIKELNKRNINKFIIAGGKKEKEDFAELIKLLKGYHLNSLCEKTIEESIEEISKASMYIGNDTGFMHISGMCGLKTFGLFGDTPTNYVSYNPKIKPIIPDGYKKVGHNSRAINKISLETVINEINLN